MRPYPSTHPPIHTRNPPSLRPQALQPAVSLRTHIHSLSRRVLLGHGHYDGLPIDLFLGGLSSELTALLKDGGPPDADAVAAAAAGAGGPTMAAAASTLNALPWGPPPVAQPGVLPQGVLDFFSITLPLPQLAVLVFAEFVPVDPQPAVPAQQQQQQLQQRSPLGLPAPATPSCDAPGVAAAQRTAGSSSGGGIGASLWSPPAFSAAGQAQQAQLEGAAAKLTQQGAAASSVAAGNTSFGANRWPPCPNLTSEPFNEQGGPASGAPRGFMQSLRGSLGSSSGRGHQAAPVSLASAAAAAAATVKAVASDLSRGTGRGEQPGSRMRVARNSA